jgi:hypothetical protein
VWSLWDRVYPMSPTSESASLYCAKTLNQMNNEGADWTESGFNTNDAKAKYVNTEFTPTMLSNFQINNFSIIASCEEVRVAIFGTNVLAEFMDLGYFDMDGACGDD